ncbi:MAG TPA: hypothetical protein VN976_11835 [Verrucomicrobiae bacterium]|nr:hypothetical protein [Verrucomicrobiae bacterium]
MIFFPSHRIFLALLFCLVAPCLSSAQTPVRVVHVYVALADNQHQGIVPVRARLGDGDAPAGNLYWGAAFGVKSFFRSSKDWELISTSPGPSLAILERCVFKHRSEDVYVIADAYRGSHMREAVTDFLSAASGLNSQTIAVKDKQTSTAIVTGGGADLVVYVGHDAFMDFQINPVMAGSTIKPRMAIVLACASKSFFAPYLKNARATPLLWTTGLMAPEAYTLKAALDGWIANEDGESVRQRAAQAYDKYQHCGLRTAQRLFVTGW